MNIKPLEWRKFDFWIAYTPAAPNGNIMIAKEQDKYWPLWDCDLPGYDTLEEAQSQGQRFHDTFVRHFISMYVAQ